MVAPNLSNYISGEVLQQLIDANNRKACSGKAVVSMSLNFSRANDLFFCGNAIQAETLAALFKSAPLLKQLDLGDMEILGNFSLFPRALRECKSLAEFNLSGGSFLSSQYELLDVGLALATLPRLEHISLTFRSKVPLLLMVAPSLAGIPRNGLKSVCVSDCGGDDKILYLRDFLQFAAASATLRKLHLGCKSRRLPAASMEFIAQLVKNTTSLQELGLAVQPGTDLVALPEALRLNSSIEAVHIDGSSWEFDEACALRDTLKDHNFTLKNLTAECPLALERTAEHQACIHAIYFYLALNRKNRAKLLGPGAHPSTKDWMEAISEEDNPSIICYFLQKNPAICFPDPLYGGVEEKSSCAATKRPVLQGCSVRGFITYSLKFFKAHPSVSCLAAFVAVFWVVVIIVILTASTYGGFLLMPCLASTCYCLGIIQTYTLRHNDQEGPNNA